MNELLILLKMIGGLALAVNLFCLGYYLMWAIDDDMYKMWK